MATIGAVAGIEPAAGTGLLSRYRIVAKSAVQPLAGPAGSVGDPSLHRHGLWVQRILASPVEGNRNNSSGFLPGYEPSGSSGDDKL